MESGSVVTFTLYCPVPFPVRPFSSPSSCSAPRERGNREQLVRSGQWIVLSYVVLGLQQ